MSQSVFPPITRLSSLVVRIMGCNPGPMTLQGTNTYLRDDSRILIDSGEADNSQYLQLLTSYLAAEKVTLSHILLTHWHHDHTGGVNGILNALNDRDSCLVLKGESGDGVGTEFVPVTDGQEVVTEGATVRLIHTPGHTSDHFSLFLLEESALFSGDCVLGAGSAVFQDLGQLLSSLNRLMDLRPKVLFPGHGPVVHQPITHLQQFISHRLEREKQILSVLSFHASDGLSVQHIVRRIYTQTPENLLSAAAANVHHHLVKLLNEQRVTSAELDGQTVYWRLPEKD